MLYTRAHDIASDNINYEIKGTLYHEINTA